jgi:arginase
MLDRKSVYFVGYASGIAGSDSGSGDGPVVLKNSPIMAELTQKGLQCHWGSLIKSTGEQASTMDKVVEMCTNLATEVADLVKQRRFFVAFGGDHSCAIGTWSGVFHALDEKEELGLIWIDAHMDSHTPDTSPTGNIHGMPLASLLGHGNTKLINILQATPKLKPQNICLIGTRSYEEGEAALLKKLNVRIFFMEEVNERGMEAVMKEALSFIKNKTTRFGVTLDIDAIDPADAPGTGVVESDGIRVKEIYKAMQLLATEEHLMGVEIAEFDPHLDKNQMTEIIVSNLVQSITLGQYHD